MAYTIERKLPTAKQWMSLRERVGWATFDDATAEKSLMATPFCACAFDGEQLIGMGRVLGDGVFTFYIGNVMVLPERQGEGIGTAIMKEILSYLDDAAAPGANASLLSIQGKESFYQKFGFVIRPDDTHGSGMSLHY